MDLNKKILAYGLFFLLFLCEYLFIKFSGINVTSKMTLIFSFPILLGVIGMIIFESSMAVGLILAIYPFHKVLGSIELGIITFDLYSMGLLLLLPFCVIKNLTKKKWAFKIRSIDILIILLCLQYMFLVGSSKEIIESGFFAFKGVFIPVVSYFVIKSIIKTSKEYDELLIFFCIGIIIFALFCVLEYIQTGARIWSPLKFPIGAATILFTGFSLVVYGGYCKNTFIKAVFVLLILFALYVTYSRAYILVVLVSPFFYIFIRKRKATFVAIVIILSGALLTFISIFNLVDFSKSHSIKLRSETETAQRINNKELYLAAMFNRGQLWREGLDKFDKNPLFGNGFHSASTRGRIGYHNFFVDWLVYGGLVSFFIYITIILIQFIRYDSRFYEDKRIAANLLILIGLLANGFANGLTHGIMPTILFLFIGFNEILIGIRPNFKNK